jgi:hypothetical protein
VTEALCATCLLLKMASADIGAEKKLDNLWNIVLDMDKQLFVSEKFLTVASEDGMYSVMGLSFSEQVGPHLLMYDFCSFKTTHLSKIYMNSMLAPLST